MKKMIAALILVSVMLTGCIDPPYPEEGLVVKLELNHDFADKVYLFYMDSGELKTEEMTKRTESSFFYVLPDKEGGYLFNVMGTSDLTPGKEQWIGTKCGIKAKQIMVNYTVLDNSYLVLSGEENPQAGFSLSYSGGNLSPGQGERFAIDERIPAEAAHRREYVGLQLPPEGFSASLPWLLALHTGTEEETSKVEVDYIKFFAVTPAGEQELVADHYDEEQGKQGFSHGSLYLRYPYFFNESEYKWPLPAEISDSKLVFYPSEEKDRVWHWWASERSLLPQGTTHVKMQARVKISGSAVVQAGIDFWKDLEATHAGTEVNNREAGASRFFFESGEWQTITISTEELNPQTEWC